ncbi:uncharacterized protein MKZ38_006544 [Zalerion maritima]|uniref:NUDE domain-containing protein n=1 Tax=Zalerion maritima TaxID=339359 RepID=A0AAD5S0B5_9PEZI|nr:uncharacterized protein MKZ38_006544 [Zalerion maritima]
MAEPPSSPPSEFNCIDDAVAWYKTQYEQLEFELQDFRNSSAELEQELEKDLEQKERVEAHLKGKVEGLEFEVDEWKGKYKQSKAEANSAQNTLEKEVTTLRESNRSLQLKLRDIEVANDDFERQARNTSSSLEDLESKYNVAIERSVMMEEDIKIGEQERERLRIEAQHLREELSDLKVEAEVLQDKIKKQESRHLSTISTDISVPDSPTFDQSTGSTASSPLITTPPDSKSIAISDTVSELQDPPSPPMSDASAPPPKPAAKTPAPRRKSRLPSADHNITPKPPKNFSSSISRPSGTRVATHNVATRTPAPRSTAPRSTSHKIPTSNSLSHIRTLTAQMQRLEARVHSARSKLPAPVTTPPRYSPRSSLQGGIVPSSITIRSRKRTIGASSVASSTDDPTPTSKSHMPRLSTSGVSRLSFGPLPNRDPHSGVGSETSGISRPSSRASVTSYQRPSSRTEMNPPPRPMSRSSLGGARTPLGRPRSSLGGSIHGHSQSVTHVDDIDEEPIPTPSRRGTLTDSGIPVPRRQSGGASLGHTGKRASSVARKLEDLGETY